MLEVRAEGPEAVPFEKVGAREFAMPLRLAGTYVVHASLGGISLTGERACSAFLRMPFIANASEGVIVGLGKTYLLEQHTQWWDCCHTSLQAMKAAGDIGGHLCVIIWLQQSITPHVHDAS